MPTTPWTEHDWSLWLIDKRRAAERRAGRKATLAEVLADPEYAEALAIHERRKRATAVLAEAERAARALDVSRAVVAPR